MRKLIRTIVIILGLLVTLFVAAAVAFVIFFDPNDFKDQLANEVETATGRSLKIDGDLSLSLFPWLGVETGALTLGNARGFDKQDFAHVDAANIRVKLVPLFSGQIEMDTVTLKGLNLNLTRLANGRNNWSDLGGKTTGKTESTTGNGPSPLAALAIGGVNVENATISWDDRQAGQRVTLQQLSLKTGALQLGEAVPFSLQGRVTANQPQVDGKLAMQATLRLNPFAGEYIADGLRLKVDLQGKELPGGSLDAALNTDASVNLIEQTFKLRNIELAILGLVANGELHASNILKTTTYQGKLEIGKFSPRTLLTLTGNAPPQTADPKALQEASLSARFSGSTSSLKLEGLQARLDDTTLGGTFSIRDFRKPAAQFDLQLDQIDLDRYRTTGASQAATPAAAASAAAPLLPVELLRGLNLNGKAQIAQLRIARIDVSEIRLLAIAQQGDIRLAPMTAKLAGGSYEGDVHIDVRGNEPVFTIDERMQGVQAETLINAFSGYDALRGVGNLDARLTTRGNTDASVRSNLNGTINFRLNDGLIKGVNIDHLIRTAYALYKQKPRPGDNGVKDTVFSSLQASSTVSNGVLSNRDLAINTDNLRIAGEGNVNLVNETMKYRLAANVIKSWTGPDSEEFNELKRVTIPVIIEGPLSKLSYNVDLERLLTQKVKQNLEQKLKDAILGKEKKPAETAPAPATAPQQPAEQPKLTPEEERRLRKEEERRKKKEAAEKLLKGLFK